MPTLLILAAMKAYAMGQRNKWKDYVDVYFILRDFHTVVEITNCANEFFKGHFNELLFREHLAYFDDLDYSEKVNYRPGFEVADEEVRRVLIDAALS